MSQEHTDETGPEAAEQQQPIRHVVRDDVEHMCPRRVALCVTPGHGVANGVRADDQALGRRYGPSWRCTWKQPRGEDVLDMCWPWPDQGASS